MVEIWDYLSVSDRHNVAAVCRRFRSLALNTARLWRFINLEGSLCVPRAETLLKRAGVTPLHIRATDYHLREIRPSLPSTNFPWRFPSPPPPPLPPPPPPLHAFYPNFPSGTPGLFPSGPPSLFPYAPPPPGPFYRDCHLPRPAPIPINSLQLSAEIISRAAILDIVSQKYQSTYNLEIEPLAIPMPTLRSLRLSSLRASVRLHSVYIPANKPFFSGHTPLLRHLSVIRFNLNWSDPVFRNLTYLLVRRPDVLASVTLLVQVLRACPSLTYLGLEAAISPPGPNETASSVELPGLQRLYITDMDTRRITATLNRISAPNVLECDFTSGDWAWFDDAHLPVNTSPFNNLQATQHVILRATEHHVYRWTIECRGETNQAVRFHFDPAAVMAYYPPGAKNESNDTTRFIDTLHRSPILFGQVRSLTLRGVFSFATLPRIFELFPAIESLSTRGIRGGLVGENGGAVDILSMQYCPQLRAIDIGAWPALSPSTLLAWLTARSTPGGGHSRLSRVVVTSTQPLPSEMRSKITPMLDKFLWRMHVTPITSCDDGHNTAFRYARVFTSVSTTQQVGDGSWDSDDEEEWTRVPSPDQHPSNLLVDVQDDPTLVYCDRSLQRRWHYFAIPEM